MKPDQETHLLQGRDELRQACIDVIGLARRDLLIASHAFEPALFANATLIQALKRQLLEQRRLRLRILVSDVRAARRQADRLLALMRRLPSQFLIHQPNKAELAFEHDLWIADNTAHIKRESPRALYAQFVSQEPLNTRQQREAFEQVWLQSQPSAEFRQLS